MTDSLKTISPVDGSIYVERALASASEIDSALDAAVAGQRDHGLVRLGHLSPQGGWVGIAQVAGIRGGEECPRLVDREIS